MNLIKNKKYLLISVSLVSIFILLIFLFAYNKNNKFFLNIFQNTSDVIIFNPKENQKIRSPLLIQGKARGNWFFEATFPVTLVDWNGKIIAKSYVEAKDNWMTEDFVPFEGKLEFKNPSFPNTDINHFSHRGTLIFRNSNPSGLLENKYYFEIPIRFR